LKTIYAIPGIGATDKLFQNIATPNYQLKVLDWPLPKKEYSLKDYAKEFLKQIDASKPFYLIGVSFGGMLCSEIGDIISAEKIILISSCKTNKEFPLLLKISKLIPLYKLIPDSLIKYLAKTKRRFLGFDKSFDGTLLEMINSMPKNYFKYCVSYILNWDKTIDNKTNSIQIHGTNDNLLLCKKIKNCIKIEGGTHTMVLSKAKEINVILNKVLDEL